MTLSPLKVDAFTSRSRRFCSLMRSLSRGAICSEALTTRCQGNDVSRGSFAESRANKTSVSRQSGEPSDLPVARHLSIWDAGDDLPNSLRF